jgi:putative ABC transport system permease protein
MFKKVTASFILALQNIRSHFFHTILSLLGIVIGVASLVSILSLIDGMEKYARDQITKTTSLNSILIGTNVNKNINGVLIRKDTITFMTHQDFNDLRRSLNYPATGFLWQITAQKLIVKEDSFETASKTTGLSDFDTTFHVLHGSIITESDINHKVKKAVVTEELGKVLAGKNGLQSLIGKTVIFADHELSIAGVVKTRRAPQPELFYPISLISNEALQQAPPQIKFEAAEITNVSNIKEAIQQWLNKKFGEKNDFVITTNEFRVEQAAKGFKLFRIIMGLIVGISVLVGGIGVMNVLLISVTERTSEIGVRKAVGANKRDIVLQFLSESITISLFGSLLGLVVGILGTMIIVPIVKSLTGVPFQAAYTLNTLFVISILAVVIGIVFGTYPAMRAAKLDPVEAIRRE